jgi:2-(3-amino-3-carboxypropyl)histidine synthase
MDRQFGSFRIDIDEIEALIQREGYASALLQVPDGLMRHAAELAREIRSGTGIEVVIDGDTCYGACDIAVSRAKALGLEALVHLGHEQIPSMEIDGTLPVHYFRVVEEMDLSEMYNGLDRFLKKVKKGRVGILTTAQHREDLDKAASYLEDHGLDVLVGAPGIRETFPGQVLGCSFSAARSLSKEVRIFLFIGTGRFHPLGISLSTRKDVHCVDPITGDLSVIGKDDRERFLRIRGAQIASAQDHLRTDKRIGIILSPKPGQKRDRLARDLENLCSEKELDPYLVSMDILSPMKVRSLGFKVACSTACPRIVADDSILYMSEGIVLLSPIELRIVLGEAKFSSYLLDEEW